MSADSPRTASQPKPATQYPMTEEEIAQAAERQSNLLVLRKVAPYLWPDDMPWVKKRVVWALIFLGVSKLSARWMLSRMRACRFWRLARWG